MIPLTAANSAKKTGLRRTRQLLLDAVAQATAFVRHLPSIEILFTLAVILAINVALRLATILGDAIQGTVHISAILCGLIGVVFMLFTGFVVPDLLNERAPVSREMPAPCGKCTQTGATTQCDDEGLA